MIPRWLIEAILTGVTVSGLTLLAGLLNVLYP